MFTGRRKYTQTNTHTPQEADTQANTTTYQPQEAIHTTNGHHQTKVKGDIREVTNTQNKGSISG